MTAPWTPDQFRFDHPERCGNCRFFDKVSSCRRHAPTQTACSPSARWPEVQAGYWCGDFEPRPKEPSE